MIIYIYTSIFNINMGESYTFVDVQVTDEDGLD